MRYSTRIVIAATLVVMWMLPVSYADVPNMINYQGKLTDSTGTALDTTTSMTFTIYDDSTGGSPIWTETHSAITATGGLFNVMLGSTVALNASVFSGSQRWLETTVGVETLGNRTWLVTVPYAHRVSTVDGAEGGRITTRVTIGSGHTNTGSDAFVAGQDNSVTGDLSTISGGRLNDASGDLASIGGGDRNVASDTWTTVGGGRDDTAAALYATVGGGYKNAAGGHASTVSGGENNKVGTWGLTTIGGGRNNSALGASATVGGGEENLAGANFATVPGGRRNQALGHYSFSAGHRAIANHAGTFVWGDSADADFASTGDNQFLIRAAGGVGIGTASPATKLDVSGIVTSDGLNVDGPVAGSGFSGWDTNVGNDLLTTTAFGGDVSGVYNSIAVGNDSHTHGDATVSNSISINNSRLYAPAGAGNVGIGTTSPSQKLSVNGSATIGSLLMNSTPPHMTMSPGTSGDLVIGAGNGTGGQPGARLTFISGNAPRSYFTNGNVGIGETNPSNILQIQISSPTDPIADSWTVYSSRRWKCDFAPIEDAVDLVRKLKGVRYAWKETGERDIGLVAEDVGEVIPEVVSYEDNGVDARSVDYARLVAVLIEGMKEQQQEIEELRSRLDRLSD